jgi:hypothetical protein
LFAFLGEQCLSLLNLFKSADEAVNCNVSVSAVLVMIAIGRYLDYQVCLIVMNVVQFI